MQIYALFVAYMKWRDISAFKIYLNARTCVTTLQYFAI